MKHEPVILIFDSKEIFDEMVPVISKELSTTHILHVDNRAAAESILDSQIKFDIIFVDWQRAGTKFVDAIRSDRKNGCTPLVVMSELDTDVVIATATRHGASAFLAKPFLKKGLISKVGLVVARQDRRRKNRLCPDQPINITFNTERAGKIEGLLIDFSLDYVHICLDKSYAESMIIGDKAIIHLYIDSFKFDLESLLVRAERPREAAEENILVLYEFSDPHEQLVEKLGGMLDEYRSRW
ncbi:MAG: response regulator [Chromatiales bacterium]|nr:response regulator [Chromatiales bacterium]